MSDSILKNQFGRFAFLLSCALFAGFCGGAVFLLHSHPGSHRLLLAVQFSLVVAGVFWIRALESRLSDAGLPRWSFWPYFVLVFTAFFAAHALKLANAPETLAFFLLLQIPALLFGRPASAARQSDRQVAVIGAFEFALYLLLITGVWYVLHLLRGDVNGMAHARTLKLALDALTALLCLPWFFSVRGRLSSCGFAHWTMVYCAVVLAACMMPLALGVIGFPFALLLFLALQLPAVLMRRQASPAGSSQAAASQSTDSDS